MPLSRPCWLVSTASRSQSLPHKLLARQKSRSKLLERQRRRGRRCARQVVEAREPCHPHGRAEVPRKSRQLASASPLLGGSLLRPYSVSGSASTVSLGAGVRAFNMAAGPTKEH